MQNLFHDDGLSSTGMSFKAIESLQKKPKKIIATKKTNLIGRNTYFLDSLLRR